MSPEAPNHQADIILTQDFKEKLDNALRLMGNQHVHGPYKHLWSEATPTLGYCYVISELVHHLYPETSVKTLPTNEGTHWYLERPDGTPIDLAKDQEYDYTKGKSKNFLTQNLSKRAIMLGTLMKVI